jgi:hypothetical protein
MISRIATATSGNSRPGTWTLREAGSGPVETVDAGETVLKASLGMAISF